MARGKPRPKIRLSKRTIDPLTSDNPRGERLYDSEIKGFGVRVYPGGRKTFFLDYGPKNHRRRYTIGPYGPLTAEQARDKAKKLLGITLEGGDPLEEKLTKQAIPTFRQWAEQYLERVALRKKQARHDRQYLSLTIDRWGNKPLDKINRQEVESLMQSMADRGKTTANRWLASVRACLQDAWRSGLIPSNPAMGIKPYRENAPRSRVLSDEEYWRVSEELEKLGDPFVRTAFRILLETGARSSEVLRAKWEEIDLQENIWHIPSPKAGHPQVIPLNTATVEILQKLPRVGPYVIPGLDPNKPRSDLRNPWNRIRERTGLKDVTIHDLRRTYGLQIARTAGLHVASKLLRHADIRVTEKVYAPLGLDELRQAVEKVRGGKTAKSSSEA